ncbi:hypothetical protein CBS101457_003418 [Exobasidium rhododendri]|nr:hypothetical protein CBS101457_003418 [Exobasidium rhododendri]
MSEQRGHAHQANTGPSYERPNSWLSTGTGAESEGRMRNDRAESKISKKSRLPGGGPAIAAFAVSLVAFTIQTEAAQYVQQTLGYRKPFLSLYLGHSSFIFLFPLHLLYLRLANPRVPISHYLHLIAQNIHWQVSTPTTSLPLPAADSIRRRISTLSMRSEHSATFGDSRADEFEVEDLQPGHQGRRRILGPPPFTTHMEETIGFNPWRLLRLLAVLTIGLTIPALSWYSAVPLTTMADITTIYNTYAVWALVFSIWFLGEKWEMRKVCSVLLACSGVVLVAYGGAEHRRRPRQPDADANKPIIEVANTVVGMVGKVIKREESQSLGNALLGDILAFFGAVTMAAYEMAFKIIGTLPDEEAQKERYARLGNSRSSRSAVDRSEYEDDNTSRAGSEAEGQGLLDRRQGEEDADEEDVDKAILRKSMEVASEPSEESTIKPFTERTGLWKPSESLEGTGTSYQTISPAPEEEEEREDDVGDDLGESRREERSRRASRATVPVFDADLEQGNRSGGPPKPGHIRPQEWLPPPLPFGMHPIIITSGIGLVTLCTLWIGLPIANALGWEPFELPSDFKTVFFIWLVVFMGIIFNGCFSILLAVWGPVLASVSCLLTTVLVFVADIVLGHDFRWISLLGCFTIAAGFGVLVTGDSIH